MLKTEHLIAFAASVKCGSFSGAAMQRGQTPMAISKQISALEKKLGEPLFERSTRKIRLTGFGESFLVKAQQILMQHETLEQWLGARQGRIGGTLKVVSQSQQAYDETVIPFLSEFHQQYPDLHLVLDVQERVLDINKDPYDIYWGVGDYLGMLHPGLKRRLMWRANLGIFASPDYLERFGTPATPGDLAGHHLIGHVHQQPDNLLVINTKPHSKQTEMEAVEMMAPIKVIASQAKLAVQGVGIFNALEDNHDIVDYLQSGELVPVLKPYWFANAEVFIYYQQVKLEQAKVRAFIDFFLSKRSQW